MPTAAISEKGWVIVPKKYRQKYGMKPGSKVRVIDHGNGVSIVPLRDDPVSALRGMFADGPRLTVDLLAERRRDKANEETKIGQPLRPG